MQGVQPRIAALEPAGALEGCVHHDSGDVRGKIPGWPSTWA
jgi:hypothetical protein